MSWHDPARSLEPESETALRNELRGLLGLPAPAASSYFEVEPNPELIRLADELRHEAQRRNRTSRKAGSWVLPLAAALPLALALGGAGVWGISEKHKADYLASTLVRQQTEMQRMATAVQQLQQQPQGRPAEDVRVSRPQGHAARTKPSQVFLVGDASKKTKPKELVIPVERSTSPNESDTQRVKAP